MTYQSGTYPTQNSNSNLNMASTGCRLMSDQANGTYIDGYMAETHMIDGQALTPSSFGQTDSATGVWVAKKYSGTYGTNGFYLKFADASAATAAAIGKDSSGNGNNWTPSGISVTSGTTFDQMTDTPTLNYCVLNPLEKYQVTLSNANLSMSVGNAYPNNVRSTFTLFSGKHYWEATVNSASGVHYREVSLTKDSFNVAGGSGSSSSNPGAGRTWDAFGDNRILVNGSSVTNTLAIPATNDVLMLAYDADTQKVWFGQNGTWNNSGNPSGGTNESGTISSGSMTPTFTAYGTSNNGFDVNFGQRAFAYTPPSGFKALNTANLPTPSIKKGSLYMDATLRTGTGATASVSSLGFQPDFVWIKSRSNATAHNLFNSVIGATKGIQTTGPNAQYTDTNTLTAFNANGYSLGSDASSRGVNINTNTYVDWAWKESTTAGLDILSWTGNGTGARTINHALGVTPEFMMLRGTDARVWACWFNSMTSAAYYMDLGTSTGELVDTTMFDSTAPTSTTFRVGSYNNVNAVTYVGYFFSSIAGFSKIGSYTGNASTDGPFVWCGFRPNFVMVKDVTTSNLGWRLYDGVREPYNEMGGGLEAASTAAENYAFSVRALDFLSNGFKIRVSASGLNGSGVKFAFIAFAENPFKYARAR